MQGNRKIYRIYNILDYSFLNWVLSKFLLKLLRILAPMTTQICFLCHPVLQQSRLCNLSNIIPQMYKRQFPWINVSN